MYELKPALGRNAVLWEGVLQCVTAHKMKKEGKKGKEMTAQTDPSHRH